MLRASLGAGASALQGARRSVFQGVTESGVLGHERVLQSRRPTFLLLKRGGTSPLSTSSAGLGRVERTWAQRSLRVLGKTFKIFYGTLAVIPTSFTVAAAYHYVVGHQEQIVRAHLFFAWTGFTAIPLSMVLFAVYPFVRVFDPHRRDLLDDVQRAWARLTIAPFFTPRFEGIDKIRHLTEGRHAVVYVSNHQSWTDIYSLLCLPFPIRFVSKEEIFYIPLVGWAMGLIGHVGVRRGNRESRSSVVDACVDKLASGVSVYLFAEGTRSRDGFVQPFKRGAFVIAKEAGVPVVPISISGTGKLMPANRGETWLERGEDAPVLIRVHDPLNVEEFHDSAELLAEARRVIEAGVITEVSPSDLSANVTTATGASA